MWTLPNALSSFRILVIPFIVYLLTFPDPFSSAVAAVVFLLASLTDYFDGYLARRHRTVSAVGKILDPLADKLMIIAVLIMLAAMDRPGQPTVPAWLVVVVVAREIAVTILRGVALTEGIVMEAEMLGKYKLVLQTFSVFGLMLHYSYWGIDFYAAGLYFLFLATVLALWSGIDYHMKFLRQLHERGARAEP
jgi:CDP-diacylglycerol--glycerol-3-phosphate 3-phosphatidyltransferase